MKKAKVTRINTAYMAAGALVMAMVLSLLSIWSYTQITEHIIDLSIGNIEELAKHDEKAINSSINSVYHSLERIALQIRLQSNGTEEKLLSSLSDDMKLMDCLGMYLVAKDGYVLSGNQTSGYDHDMRASCVGRKSKFIQRQNIAFAGGNSRECLLVGVVIQPLEVEGHIYDRIAMQMNIDTVEEELKIDLYDGRGYSSVIDQEGNYIDNMEQRGSSRAFNNFYEMLEAGKLPEEYPIEKVRKMISRQLGFSFQYEREGGEACVIVFDPMEEIDWFFVTAVPRSVFEYQSLTIIKLFAVVMSLAVLAMLVTLGIVLWHHVLEYRKERRHRRQLAEALALAEQANRAKTVFLNNMSHDIRTPMNAVIGFTELAITHLDNRERVGDYLKKIRQSSKHLLSLINDVLDMSRIESGKMVIEETPENLADILQELRDIVLADIKKKRLDFTITTDNVSDENIYCDKLRLNQVLLNLLSNAIKFTPEGGQIAVRIRQDEAGKPGYAAYELKVKDTGIGMAPEFMKDVFTPFARERNTTVSGIQGTGLGMAITKNIVDMMGGTIEVASEVGNGTEFTIRVEFRVQENAPQSEEVSDLQGRRALVVDSDIHLCQSVTLMLYKIGMRSAWTVHGEEALARAKEAQKMEDAFDVYLVNWHMADLDGIEVVRRIHQMAGDVPIIMMTTFDWTDVEEEAREAGVTDFANKPIFPSNLTKLLLKSFGKENGTPALSDDSEEFFRGRRILLAEDNEMNREIAEALLGQYGFLIETVVNGQEALEAVKRSKPGWYDMVLMDVQMPVMGGYDATKAIRALDDPKLANIPIVAMTANAFEEDKRLAAAAGMNAHVSKPIDIPLLKKTMREIIENAKR